MRLPKSRRFLRRGVIPLFVLLIIGVVVLVGGVYVVREQFLKEGKSGKATYDEAKIREQAKNPQKLSEIKEEPKGKLAEATYVYRPTGSTSSPTIASSSAKAAVEPGFSINPPAGWENVGSSADYKVRFRSTQEDRDDQENGLYAKSSPQISVSIGQVNGTLEDLVSLAKQTTPKSFEKMTIISEQKVTFAGRTAYRFEAELTTKGMGLHSLDYYLEKDGYIIHLAGTAIRGSWSNREPIISGSMATFKFL